MSRIIKVAAIQMDATPAPTENRLKRAEYMVTKAAQTGAQLVVLPEIFNTGYGYSDENHTRAEAIEGPTVTWMKDSAARHNIHLAGSLMLLDHDEVYNALLLFAPDGRMWRYNKNYPWAWERGYFRDGHDIMVAKTDLGDLGLMICWDSGHTNLWKRYAGQVDMMIISSCPPDVGNPTYHFPNGDQVSVDDLGPIFAFTKGSGQLVFGDMINQQTAWLGTPTVNTVGTGHIKTDIPYGLATLALFLPAVPWLIKYIPQAKQMQMSCDFVQGCKIVAPNGEVLSELSQAQGESFTVADVTLADKKPTPQTLQPPSPMPWFTYLSSDIILPWLTIPVYRNGLRRAWGTHMAPVQASTQRWLGVLVMSVIFSLGLGFILSRFLRGK